MKLTNQYFSRDVSMVEMEFKFNLLSLDPFGFIFQVDNWLRNGELKPFFRQFCMGKQSTKIQEWTRKISFYGQKVGGDVHQVFMLGHSPHHEMVFPVVKIFKLSEIKDGSSVLTRHEDKSFSKWMTMFEFDQLRVEFERKLNLSIFPLGTMQREKVWLYAGSSETYRNFSINVDRCTAEGKSTLSQVEIEYKGRSGIHLPANREIVMMEIMEISTLLSMKSGLLQPTNLTKIKWIIR